MTNILFTENFVKKINSVLDENPEMGQEIIEQLDNFELNSQNPNIHQLEEEGYVFRVGNYRLFFNFDDNQVIFLTLVTIDEMFLAVQNAKKKETKGLVNDLVLI
jgi:mRNA-degrading endonuclease RelE of RelBE toxin-antitoxin system